MRMRQEEMQEGVVSEMRVVLSCLAQDYGYRSTAVRDKFRTDTTTTTRAKTEQCNGIACPSR